MPGNRTSRGSWEPAQGETRLRTANLTSLHLGIQSNRIIVRFDHQRVSGDDSHTFKVRLESIAVGNIGFIIDGTLRVTGVVLHDHEQNEVRHGDGAAIMIFDGIPQVGGICHGGDTLGCQSIGEFFSGGDKSLCFAVPIHPSISGNFDLGSSFQRDPIQSRGDGCAFHHFDGGFLEALGPVKTRVRIGKCANILRGID